MKKIKKFFEDFDFEGALLVFLICSAVVLFLLGMILALAYSNASWLWMWLAAILCISFEAGMY